MNEKVFTRGDPDDGTALPITYSYAVFDGVVVVTGTFWRGRKEVNVAPAAIPMEVLRWLAQELLPVAFVLDDGMGDSGGVVTVTDEAVSEGATEARTCRKCANPIAAGQWRFGSDLAGWEHMQGECP